MSGYIQDLVAALKRTHEWNLACAGSEMLLRLLPVDPTTLPVPQRELVQHWSRELQMAPIERVGNCAATHYNTLMHIMPGGVPMLPVLTIGDVLVDGKPRYNVTRNSLRQLLRKGRSRAVMPIHVWLTWPDMTVMDLTLLSSMAYHAGEDLDLAREDALVLYGADDLARHRLTYRPWLVGERVLHEVGALMPGAIERLDFVLRLWWTATVEGNLR